MKDGGILRGVIRQQALLGRGCGNSTITDYATTATFTATSEKHGRADVPANSERKVVLVDSICSVFCPTLSPVFGNYFELIIGRLNDDSLVVISTFLTIVVGVWFNEPPFHSVYSKVYGSVAGVADYVSFNVFSHFFTGDYFRINLPKIAVLPILL